MSLILVLAALSLHFISGMNLIFEVSAPWGISRLQLLLRSPAGALSSYVWSGGRLMKGHPNTLSFNSASLKKCAN